MTEERREPSGREQLDWKPRPDPTVLSTQALNREIERVGENIDQRIAALENVFTERLKAVDEKFNLMERYRVEQKGDTKSAVVDALAAAKEIVREQSANFKEQLTQITLTFSTALAGLTKQVDDMKERVAKIEAIKIGGNEAKGSVYTFAAVGISFLLLIASVTALLLSQAKK